MGGLNQQTAQVPAAVATNPASPFLFTTVIKSRVESDIFDQLPRIGKTLDVADNGPQSKGDLVPDTAQSHQGQEHWFSQYFLGDEALPVRALFFGMTPVHEVTVDHLLLTDRPGVGLANALLIFLALAEG